MPITRGYSFGANEFVTDEKLHRLVDSARVSGLTTNEFDGDIRGLVQATPASINDGTIFFLHETSASLVAPSALSRWLHPTYLVHYFGQWVSLFGGDRLESGRFFVGTDFASAINAGRSLLTEGLTSQGDETLTLGDIGTAPPKVNSVGSAVRPAAVGAAARAGLIGYHPAFASARDTGSPWFDTLFDDGGADSQWAKSSASHTSGFYGFRLNNVALGDSDIGRLQPAYMMGGPIFRDQ